MKKFIALLLAVMLMLSATGCSLPLELAAKVKGVGNDTSVQDDLQTDMEDDTDDSVLDDYDDVDEETGEEKAYDIDEQVIYDNGSVNVAVHSMVDTGYGTVILTLDINNTGSQNITVTSENFLINGIVIDSALYAEVNAGKKIREDMYIMKEDLVSRDITTVKDIEIKFSIVNGDNFDDIVVSDLIKFSTNDAGSYEQQYNDKGLVAVDKDGIKVVVQGIVSSDDDYVTKIRFYIENNTDKTLQFNSADVSVNGSMMMPGFYPKVPAGRKAYADMTFINTELEDNDIEKINEIELNIIAMDSEWNMALETGNMKITFE